MHQRTVSLRPLVPSEPNAKVPEPLGAVRRRLLTPRRGELQVPEERREAAMRYLGVYAKQYKQRMTNEMRRLVRTPIPELASSGRAGSPSGRPNDTLPLYEGERLLVALETEAHSEPATARGAPSNLMKERLDRLANRAHAAMRRSQPKWGLPDPVPDPFRPRLHLPPPVPLHPNPDHAFTRHKSGTEIGMLTSSLRAGSDLRSPRLPLGAPRPPASTLDSPRDGAATSGGFSSTSSAVIGVADGGPRGGAEARVQWRWPKPNPLSLSARPTAGAFVDTFGRSDPLLAASTPRVLSARSFDQQATKSRLSPRGSPRRGAGKPLPPMQF